MWYKEKMSKMLEDCKSKMSKMSKTLEVASKNLLRVKSTGRSLRWTRRVSISRMKKILKLEAVSVELEKLSRNKPNTHRGHIWHQGHFGHYKWMMCAKVKIKQPMARVCGICTSPDHYSDVCSSLLEPRTTDHPEAYAANIYNNRPNQQQQNYDPSSSRYNPGVQRVKCEGHIWHQGHFGHYKWMMCAKVKIATSSPSCYQEDFSTIARTNVTPSSSSSKTTHLFH
ncbi:hypothetical protein Lal_00015414 [Lupinus albus]|nr:hypothetical protein Lal_00015414 [Lupinus albus]